MIRRMTQTMASAIVAVVWICSVSGEPTVESSAEGWQTLMGAWQVTSAQTSLILSIQPDRKALILWIRKGGRSQLYTSWEPCHGGVLVQGMPRIRLWAGRDGRDNELRAELEAIPEIGFDPNEKFHDHFFMRRIDYEQVPQEWLTRPIPERWTKDTLGEDWSTTAGRKPLPKKMEATEQDPGEVRGTSPRPSASAEDAVKNLSPTNYCWKMNGYVPPDFESFFPDDADGGKALDALFSSKQDRVATDKEILDTVRQGLRRTTQHRTLILSWIGNKYIWGKNPQNPYAVEIMYQAAHPDDRYGTRHYAIYFGLSVLKNKTTNVLHVLMDNYLADEDRGRIAWGLRSDNKAKSEVADLLLQKLDQYQQMPPEQVVLATEFYEKVTGEKPPAAERFSNLGRFLIMFRPSSSFSPNTKDELLEKFTSVIPLDNAEICEARIERGDIRGFVVASAQRRDAIVATLTSNEHFQVIGSELLTQKRARYLKLSQ